MRLKCFGERFRKYGYVRKFLTGRIIANCLHANKCAVYLLVKSGCGRIILEEEQVR